MEDPRRRGGVIALIAALSGLLTALAALLTAEGTFHSASASGRDRVVVSPGPAGPTVTATPTSTVPPPAAETSQAGSVDLDSSTEDQLRTVQGGGADDLVTECADGNTSACARILADLVSGCTNGLGASCDALYAVSPGGSTLSRYGATCGYRFSAAAAGDCVDR